MKRSIEVNNKLKEIGNRCKQFRENLGISQLQVANSLGLSQGMISLFESGYLNNAIILNWYVSYGYGG